jgi:hypothetical protein
VVATSADPTNSASRKCSRSARFNERFNNVKNDDATLSEPLQDRGDEEAGLF